MPEQATTHEKEGQNMSIRRWRPRVVAAALSAVATGVFAATAAAAPPANTVPPSISGTPTVGQTLTASQGTWSNNPTSFAYQWLRCNGGGNNRSEERRVGKEWRGGGWTEGEKKKQYGATGGER